MVEVTREVERKYELADGSGADLPELSGVAGVATVRDDGVHDLDAVYHDTADQRLAADGVTLRRRTGGDDSGWHLKLPVAEGVRDEILVPLQDKVPAQLAALVRSRVRSLELLPVLRLRSERHVLSLLDDNGEVLAEVGLDQVRAERQPGGEDAQWTEVEVELGPGQKPGVLDALEERLLAAGLRRTGSESKLERALSLTGSEEDEPSKRAKKARKTEKAKHAKRSKHPKKGHVPETAGEVVLEYAAEQVRALVWLDPEVRRELPNSVHRMRVATRRLRSCFRSYRKVLDPQAVGPLGTELRWLAGELGVDRDREVLTARLRARADELPRPLRRGPLAGRLRAHDRGERSGNDGSRRRLLDALDSARYLELLDALEALLAEPPYLSRAQHEPERVLRKTVARDFDRLAARVDAVLAEEPGTERDKLAHQARKAAKRARYAAEAARPVFGKRAKAYARRMTELQDLLGLQQDTVMARSALLELASEAEEAGESSFSYGVLYEREALLAEECAAKLPPLWGRIARKRKLS